MKKKNLCCIDKYGNKECAAYDTPKDQEHCIGYIEDLEDGMRRCIFYGVDDRWMRCGNEEMYPEAELQYRLELL